MTDYFGRVMEALAATLDDCPAELLREYALVALVKGAETTLKDTHHAWAAWKIGGGWVHGPVKDPVAKTHPDLVPFGDLSPEVQERDRKYMDAIREVAAAAPA